MSNHPISLVPPAQILQANLSQDAERITPNNLTKLPSTGHSDQSTATVALNANTVATDVQTMQSNDATAFVYGSTTSNKTATSSDYTTVDDAAKLVNRAAIDNDTTRRINREDKKKSKQSLPIYEDDDEPMASENIDESTGADSPTMKNTMTIMSHGLV